MKDVKSIMLIDDNKIDLFVNQKIIEIFQPEVKLKTFLKSTLAISYLKMLEFNTDIESSLIPNIILLDINMPEMDGFQFLCELEEMDIVKNNSIEVYMLSSSAYPDDINRAKNHVLCSNYFNKPLTNRILEVIFEQKKIAI